MYYTFKALRDHFILQLSEIYSEREAKQLFSTVVEFVIGWTPTTVIVEMQSAVNQEYEVVILDILNQLKTHKPIQYITKRTWFNDRWFNVNPAVLIPRPETEELILWILEAHKSNVLHVLDIGTGSGIIPISLQSHRGNWEIFGCDVSEDALKIAESNKDEKLRQNPVFYKEDILNPQKRYEPKLDIIISNPPYVLNKDKNEITKSVLDFEPHLALFVEDEDPLLFYRAIVDYAHNNLKSGGYLYFEIHENHAQEVSELLKANHFQSVDIKFDMQGKQRMVKGRLGDE